MLSRESECLYALPITPSHEHTTFARMRRYAIPRRQSAHAYPYHAHAHAWHIHRNGARVRAARARYAFEYRFHSMRDTPLCTPCCHAVETNDDTLHARCARALCVSYVYAVEPPSVDIKNWMKEKVHLRKLWLALLFLHILSPIYACHVMLCPVWE